MNSIFVRLEGLVSSINYTTEINDRLNSNMVPKLKVSTDKIEDEIKVKKSIRKSANFELSFVPNSDEKSLLIRIKSIVNHTHKKKKEEEEFDDKFLHVVSCEMTYDSFYILNDNNEYSEEEFIEYVKPYLTEIINNDFKRLRKQLLALLKANDFSTRLPLVLIKRGASLWG